jgi:hypothetical protein
VDIFRVPEHKQEQYRDIVAATKTFLESNEHKKTAILHYLDAFSTLQDAIPQTHENWASWHGFPIQEAYQELFNSVAFCLVGEYRYAFIALRSVMELGLLSVYFDRDDQAHETIVSWAESLEDTPRFKKLWACIEGVANVKLYDGRFDLRGRLLADQKDLHNFVHSKGIQYSSSSEDLGFIRFLVKGSVPSGKWLTGEFRPFHFDEQRLEGWLAAAGSVVHDIAVIHLLKYPLAMQYFTLEDLGSRRPAGGLLSYGQSTELKRILADDEKAFLQHLSDNDPAVIEDYNAFFAIALANELFPDERNYAVQEVLEVFTVHDDLLPIVKAKGSRLAAYMARLRVSGQDIPKSELVSNFIDIVASDKLMKL